MGFLVRLIVDVTHLLVVERFRLFNKSLVVVLALLVGLLNANNHQRVLLNYKRQECVRSVPPSLMSFFFEGVKLLLNIKATFDAINIIKEVS